MQKIKKNLNKIIIAIVLIFIATFVYNYINKKEAGDVKEVIIGGKNETARKILETLNELEKINPDYGFFTEKLANGGNAISFFQLVDFSEKELPEKDYGKNNPFLKNSTALYKATVIRKQEVIIPKKEESLESDKVDNKKIAEDINKEEKELPDNVTE